MNTEQTSKRETDRERERERDHANTVYVREI